jgi:hypothetical protein
MKPHLALLSLLPFLSHAAEVRTWTDKTTQKTIEASMVSADPQNKTVTLSTAAGQTYTLPVARFVDADLAYIRANLNAPAAPAAPAAPGTPAAPVAAAPAAPKGAPAPALAEPLVLVPAKKFKGATGSSILGTVKKERPRILMNAAGFAGLKAKIAADPNMQKMMANVKATCEEWLNSPTMEQKRGEATGPIDNGPHNEALHRFSSFGILQYVEADPRFKDRMIGELTSLARFTNWKPEEHETVADFTVATCMGYDWFRTALKDKDAELIRKAIIELGMGAMTAHLKGEPLPATAKRPEPGTTAEPPKPPAKKKVAEDASGVRSREDIVMAAALMIAAITLADEEPSVASPAANLAAKVLGDGITQFAPEGIFTEGLGAGERVMEAISQLVMTYRAACGQDFGMRSVEGLPQSLMARIALNGPTGLFNYGDAAIPNLSKEWVLSYMLGEYGNPGFPAVMASKAAAKSQTYGLNQAGELLFHNRYAAGYGTPTQLDYAFPTAQVASLRSAYDRNAFFVGIKGGDNSVPGAQLDLGTFVVDALGVRWGIDLGMENGRGMVKSTEDPARFKLYREGSKGQNVMIFAQAPDPEEEKKAAAAKGKGKGTPAPPADPGNQPLDAKAAISGFTTTPERGAAIVDLKDAYSARAKSYLRGAMLVRGPKPYIMLQDEISIKSASSPDWVMHTKAEVAVNGKTATLTQGGKTLIATLLSPEGASFAVADVPEAKNLQEGSYKGIRTLKVPLLEAKGDRTITVVFSETAPEGLKPVPLAQWIPKKR